MQQVDGFRGEMLQMIGHHVNQRLAAFLCVRAAGTTTFI